ncbi:MAG: 30S ribosomal protein S6 [Propionibacteriaceae bacterium]|jgi:small subunit ribosomal protein S6|nr:30S ribosomal protein S6 [Propionibacteriaceae bacterium]
MRKYEIMVIIDPEVDDRQVEGLIDKPLKPFQKAGGTVDSTDIWGRRRLAYPIKKKTEGIYVVLNLTAEPAVVKELDRQFTLNEQILRTKVIRPDIH